MANRFGKGYFTDWNEMIATLKKGSERAFKKACQKICDECNDRIRGGIYGTYQPDFYNRTEEMWDMDYLTADVQGLECQFRFDNQEFMSLTIGNPEHHALSDDVGNGYDTTNFMEKIISPIHDNFMSDIRDYIQKNFADIYRQCCKEEGFELK